MPASPATSMDGPGLGTLTLGRQSQRASYMEFVCGKKADSGHDFLFELFGEQLIKHKTTKMLPKLPDTYACYISSDLY